jgi:hypothetical protein
MFLTLTMQYRNRPGTTLANWNNFGDQTLDGQESSFAVQQYLEYLVNRKTSVEELLKCPESQDENVWQYEHIRLICHQLNALIIPLQLICDPNVCTEMKAGEFQYLCAAHQAPQNCSALDYTIHTVDGSIALLNSNKFFQSRISISVDACKHFSVIIRRLYRIFAHCWHFHRELYDSFERETQLFCRFQRFSEIFNMPVAKFEE